MDANLSRMRSAAKSKQATDARLFKSGVKNLNQQGKVSTLDISKMSSEECRLAMEEFDVLVILREENRRNG